MSVVTVDPAAIQDRIAVVKGAANKAIAQLDAKAGGWFGDDWAKSAASSIRSLQPKIETWQQNAFDSLAGKLALPSKNGWPGWIEAGNVFLKGVAELAQEGQSGKLDALKVVVKEAPATSAKAIKTATAEASKFVTDTATGVITPLLKPIGMIALVAGGLLTLLVVGKKNLLK
jgi:hypothetical protein